MKEKDVVAVFEYLLKQEFALRETEWGFDGVGYSQLGWSSGVHIDDCYKIVTRYVDSGHIDKTYSKRFPTVDCYRLTEKGKSYLLNKTYQSDFSFFKRFNVRDKIEITNTTLNTIISVSALVISLLAITKTCDPSGSTNNKIETNKPIVNTVDSTNLIKTTTTNLTNDTTKNESVKK